MKSYDKKIVICGGVRTPIGHLSKGLSRVMPEDLMQTAIVGLLTRSSLYAQAVDGVIVGWVGQGSHAPNIARVAVLKARLPEKAHAMTIQANCVSGMEAISSSARHILLGEGDLYIAGGTESMSTFPYAIRGSRSLKELRSLDAVKENWESLQKNPDICITDCMEEGLTDPVVNLSMAATAEICAQMYAVSRQAQDEYAATSYKRALEAEKGGFYGRSIVAVKKDEQVLLEKDEYPFLRESLVEKPQMIGRAPLLFDSPSFSIKKFYENFGDYIVGKKYDEKISQATVTLFNSCARSDGAAAVIVASEERAKDLGLEILAEIVNWAYWGSNPAYMGVSPVFATWKALGRAGLKYEDMDQIELHEAFAAACLSIFKVGKEKYNQDWEKSWRDGKLNPHGGSIALGHPLAATGTRIVLNLMDAMRENPKSRYGLATACAAGGLGGAIILQRYS